MNTDSGLKETEAQTSQRDTPSIESGMIGCGFWARCGGQYAGGSSGAKIYKAVNP